MANIDSIKERIAHNNTIISNLRDADFEIVERTDELGDYVSRTISLAHLVAEMTYGDGRVQGRALGHDDWAVSYSTDGFASKNAALAYVTAAIKNHLKGFAQQVVSNMTKRNAEMEAALS